MLEVFSLVLIFNFNNFQKVTYLNSSNRISASVYNSFNSVFNYFELAKINRSLAEENAKLRSAFEANLLVDINSDSNQINLGDENKSFNFVSGRVINNSVNKPYNYITINKGRKHGVKPDQGILSSKGLVGVVTHVSESFSIGLPVLNLRWSVSAKLKKNGFYGSLAWMGGDYRFADLHEIPLHINLAQGDSIVTSGFSSIFPEGINIGTIHSFSQPEGENYYEIKVKLSPNFKAINFVEIIENVNKEEITELNKLIQSGQTSN